MKRYAFLALLATAILSAAAVFLGGINQDEGWYLYAAQLVAEGKMPYRDFFYTQGPLLPILYAPLEIVWRTYGLLGARVLTVVIGLAGVVVAVGLARRLVPTERKGAAGVLALLLLGCNLYHLYYVGIPKTYAIGALFVLVGFYLLSCALDGMKGAFIFLFMSGVSLAFAAGARISLGALLAVVGVALLLKARRFGFAFLWFGIGGVVGLAAVYGPFILQEKALDGLLAAQRYHAARGGFSPVFVVGSLSRLVRWYLPVFIILGLGLATAKNAFAVRQRGKRREETPARPYASVVGGSSDPATSESQEASEAQPVELVGNPLQRDSSSGSSISVRSTLKLRRDTPAAKSEPSPAQADAIESDSAREGVGRRAEAVEDEDPDRGSAVAHFMVWTLIVSFLVVFAVQMLAPFPYEDYQVPIMGLLAVAAVALVIRSSRVDGRADDREEPCAKLQLLTLGLSFACAFGSPLLEKWTTNGQDRFWTRVKEKPEIMQLRDAAEAIRSAVRAARGISIIVPNL